MSFSPFYSNVDIVVCPQCTIRGHSLRAVVAKIVELIDGGDEKVVAEVVLVATEAEADDVVVFVNDFQALDGGGCQKAGHEGDLTDVIVADEATTLDEVFIPLEVIEPPPPLSVHRCTTCSGNF